MLRTALTDALRISNPIIQAPMAGGGDTVELVAAVSNSGGVGSIGAAYLKPEQIVERGKQVRAATPQIFGINLFAPLDATTPSTQNVQRAVSRLSKYYKELGIEPPTEVSTQQFDFNDQLAACFESGAGVFSFTFGIIPKPAVQQVKRRGIFLMGTATTVEEAIALENLGVDAVIAQGCEAGGHRGTFMGPFEAGMVGGMCLIPQTCSQVGIPVVASGGIMDGRGIAAAIALGACGVQLGTAFLTCKESGVAECYKDAILNAQEDSTRLTRAFSGRPARGIENRVLRDLAPHQDEILPFPAQNSLTRAMRNEATKQNRSDYLSLWAGQGTRLSRRSSAAELVHSLVAETEEVIRTLQSRVERERSAA
ncbi:MAG TPA: nitronate monooxygenase [Candidatus Acidoferrales bacterium]|nr:nitronate monooxygenase [Candidatus Acidoferrales bacterium]